MLQMFVITLREGIEAFLIVAIALAYLRKTGRNALVPAVFWGTGTGVLLSVFLGVKLAQFAVQPLWEGILALVAVVLVTSMVVYMLRTAKHLRSHIGARLEAAAQKVGQRRVARRLRVHGADDYARRHGNRVSDRCRRVAHRLGRHHHRRPGRHFPRGADRVGMVALRSAGESCVVFPGHVDFPAALRAAAAAVQFPRIDRSESPAARQ